MAFTVVSDPSPQSQWVPVLPAAVIFVGDLVSEDKGLLGTTKPAHGVDTYQQADGVNNITNNDRPMGVVIGHNLTAENSTFNSTAMADQITGTTAGAILDSTTNYVSVEGPWGKADKRAMAKIQLIGPSTLLRAPLKNDAPGTAPSLLTCTTADANGLSVTTNATDVAPVAALTTIYCRTGLNAGIYRSLYTTSTTVHVTEEEWPHAIAVGDTFVTVPLRTHGRSYIRCGDETYCTYINVSETPATNYDVIHVVRLDLSVAGSEYVDFYFDARSFSTT